MYKVYITKEKFNELKKSEEFINVLRLLRMNSAITTLESLMARISNDSKKRDLRDDTSRDKRDRLEIIQYYGAVLYESIKTIYNMKSQLEQLNEYKNHINDIDDLFNEWHNPDSFTNTILKTIRDKLTFHFDRDVFQEAILNMDLPDTKFIIIEGDSERRVDLNSPSIPSLYFNYLISHVKESGSEEDKLRYIYNQMELIAEKVREVVESIAGELLEKIKVHSENT